MPLLTSLLVLLITARLLGKLFVRFNQPAIVGEMTAGVLLGPAMFNLIQASPALSGISELAVFLVVLSAGLEMDFKDVVSVFRNRNGLIIATLGFLVPLVAGVLVGIAFRLDVMRTVFLGLCVSITALPVAVRILDSFKLLQSNIARYSVATAILNDVVALLALGVIFSLPVQRDFGGIFKAIGVTGGKLLLLVALIMGFNRLLETVQSRGVHIERIPEKLAEFFGGEALLGVVITFVLIFASISEILGFHFVIGAFFGALLLSKKLFFASRYSELEKSLASVTGGFLAPVFFASLGLEFNFGAMQSLQFVMVVLGVSIASKILAGWLGGRIAGMPDHEALGVGIILNGRGVMELVIASIAFEKGFIGQGLFSTLVLMGVVTTVITPILFRKFTLPGLAQAAQ